MKHLFVPYSLALLAKEKGFYEPCFGYYEIHDHSNKEVFTYAEKPQPYSLLDMIQAPLYQQLVDWFREKHKINIIISPDRVTVWYVCAENNGTYKELSSGKDYYEALTTALTEAFKLI